MRATIAARSMPISRRAAASASPRPAAAAAPVCRRTRSAQVVGAHARVGEHPAGQARVVREQGEQQVLGADRPGPRFGFPSARRDHVARPVGEPFEHHISQDGFRGRPPACFLCTACRLTPSTSAISCQDQPVAGRCRPARPRAARAGAARGRRAARPGVRAAGCRGEFVA